MSRDIAEWQRRFFAQPKVWMTVDSEGTPVNIYDSEEAANVEMEWRRQHKERGYRVVYQFVHSLELSKDRWLP